MNSTLIFMLSFLWAIFSNSSETLRVLSFNVWDGGNAFGIYTDQRIEKICDRFQEAFEDEQEGPDLILIQELWPVRWRWDEFSRCGYPHYARVERPFDQIKNPLSWVQNRLSGDKADTGLRILSRYPFSKVKRHTYSNNGHFHRVFSDAEYSVSRSAMFVEIKHPTAGRINIFNTHLVSTHLHNSGTNYHNQRWLQLRELSDFIKREAIHGPIILGGDFNFGPNEYGNEIYNNDLFSWSDLMRGPFRFLYHATSLEDCSFCPSNNEFLIALKGLQRDNKPDHIFASHDLVLLNISLVLNERIIIQTPEGEKEVPYSDHYGVEAVFDLKNLTKRAISGS